jgi:hypothetical protein
LLDPFGAERVKGEINFRQPALKRARLLVYQSAQLNQCLLFIEHMAQGPELMSYSVHVIPGLCDGRQFGL